MKPHPRIRKAIKWGGAAVTVLLVVVWIGSGWMKVVCLSQRFTLGFQAGSVLYVIPRAGVLDGIPSGVGWGASASPYWNFLFRHYSFQSGESFLIPAWPLLLLVILVASSTCRLDALARRRALAGLCPKCNYDRAGIAKDAVCPECGAAPLALEPTKSASHA